MKVFRLVDREMNAQDVQQLIKLVPASATVLRAGLCAGQIRNNPSGPGLRFSVPTGTLDDSVYDLFRPGDYILSCVCSVEGTGLAYVTRKVVKSQGHRIKIGGLERMANPAFGKNLSFCGTSSRVFTRFVVPLVIVNKYNIYVQYLVIIENPRKLREKRRGGPG